MLADIDAALIWGNGSSLYFQRILPDMLLTAL